MITSLYSCSLYGVTSFLTEIEVDIKNGLPCVIIVGLPDKAVQESKDRVKSALINAGFKFPNKRIIINLAPADIKKEGPLFDLPIALGILQASGQIHIKNLQEYVFVGELSLDNRIRAVKGILPIAIQAKQENKKAIVIPKENAKEAAIVNNLKVYPTSSLIETVHFLEGEKNISSFKLNTDHFFAEELKNNLDFSDVKGQAQVKRALEVAVCGGHNILMIGPPGSGKTMLAKRIPSILPAMNINEAIETTKIHSIMGLLKSGKPLITQRPFRSPHHTISNVALVGGGDISKRLCNN